MVNVYPTLAGIETLTYGGPISPVIQVDNLFWISGLTAIDPSTGNLVEEVDFRIHAIQTMENISMTLDKAAQLSWDHVIKVNAYLQRPEDFPTWNEVCRSYFREPFPCRTTVGSPLILGLIEVDVIACQSPRI